MAHESRVLVGTGGGFRITVGFHVEPAFEDQDGQGIDFIVNAFNGETANDLITAPVDLSNPEACVDGGADTIDVQVKALYLSKEAQPTPVGDAKVYASLDITALSPLHQEYGSPNNYLSYFRTTHPGAYGFVVKGSIHSCAKEGVPYIDDEGNEALADFTARDVTFEETFVCGAGTKGDGRFNCVEVLQPFPGSIGTGYQHNQPLKGYGLK